ncbi:dihydropteroate synthase [Thermoplasma volcanium GSS1]|uniref:dihydropteroate synthase n=1 Tax=Thermoplasma volcanium (strain ATCC 51530 / DSM 4299 / JCM 9571 / NBRC 15438 / GSS1) TaxID=273116 RepID=Q97CE7_THEVO|nr:dihydropteroate synthase [Thermoplasma volcanium]BAB59296.1 dihydropteroate synthase [Thermoplasma volcanium GSS1]
MDGLIIPRRGAYKQEDGKYLFEVISEREPPVEHQTILENGIKKYIVKLDQSALKDLMRYYSVFPSYEDQAAERIFAGLDEKPIKPKIMGIINATPDSFYSGSRVLGNEDLIFKIIDEKPDIVDVGAESTRPGSKPVDPTKEYERLLPVIKIIRDYSDIPVSIDSRHPSVIKNLVKYEINYINDISGFTNKEMIDLAKDSSLYCVVMHMRGSPQDMQNFTNYDDVIVDVIGFLLDRANNLLANDVAFGRIISDPGIGFAKDLKGNIEILRNIKSFHIGMPLLVGTSRKTFIGTITGQAVEGRLPGTIGTSIYLANNRVSIIRVHDVRENKDAINTYLSLAQ